MADRIVTVACGWVEFDGKLMPRSEMLSKQNPLTHKIKATLGSFDEGETVSRQYVVDEATALLYEADPLIEVVASEPIEEAF